MHRDVALVQVGQLGLTHRHHGALGDEDGHRSALGVVVLPGDVQHLGADHVGEGGEDQSEPLGVVLFVDIGDVIGEFPGGFGVADIVDIEAERLCQVIEAIQLELFTHPTFSFYPHSGR